MSSPLEALTASLAEPAAGWLAASRARLAREGPGLLPVLFPALARRLGRDLLPAGLHRDGAMLVETGAWRRCDAAGLALAEDCAPDDASLVDLFLHGDMEERIIVLRALGLLPITDGTIRLLGEVQRTNIGVHFEAAVCESNLAVRALEHGGWNQEDLDRLVLKAAFLDVRLPRLFEVFDHVGAETSRMVQGLATEREAAGRDPWVDTNRVVARAPVDGSLERLRRGLADAREEQRLAAAEGVAYLRDAELLKLAAERIDHESSESIRSILAAAVTRA